MKSKDQIRRLVGILRIFVISGAICLLISFYVTWDNARFVRTANVADGVVVNLKEERDVHARPTITPLISFQDATKKDWIVRYSWSSATPVLKIGDHVRALYHPEDPASPRFDEPEGIDSIPRTLRSIGIIHLGIGLLMVIAYRNLS
jgi:hypothetical protein